MYTLLIADDETIIREGLKQLLDWNALGFSLCGEASTGKQTYHQMMALRPDVVLLDIRMPEMTGLEVIRLARENGFSGKVIILSGYSDFKLAQQAIRYGVSNYLTKPIDEEELSAQLDSIREELDSASMAQASAKAYLSKAREGALLDLFSGQSSLSARTFEELELSGSVYQVAVCAKDECAHAGKLCELLHLSPEDMDCLCVSTETVMLLRGSDAVRKLEDYARRGQYPPDAPFVAYGGRVHTPAAIRFSYEQACSLLKRRFFCPPQQKMIGYEELPRLERMEKINGAELLQDHADRLLSYIQTFNRSMIADTLASLEEKLRDSNSSIADAQLLLTDLFLLIKDKLIHLYPGVSLPLRSNSEIIRQIGKMHRLTDIICFFSEQFERIMDALGSSSRSSVLDDVLRYIRRNFRSNLTLETIAPLFGYNSSYLGKLLSKHVGESFNAYLDRLRIEEAKRLLTETDMKVYAIAERLGYSNVDYFHVKFKKYLCQSPAEYRKAHKTTAGG
ncbi:MAG: response regulator [Aristaeellaceae bacterium]